MDFEGKIKPDGETSFIDLSSCDQVPWDKQLDNALEFKKTNRLVIRPHYFHDHLASWRIYNRNKPNNPG